MPKTRFSKAAFTEDIDSRIRQRVASATSQRKGSAARQVNEGIAEELQEMRKKLTGQRLYLEE